MEVISDVLIHKELVKKILDKHGCAAEHQFYCYFYNREQGQKDFIFKFEDDSAILAFYEEKNKEWEVFSEIIAPKEKQLDYFSEFLDYVFSNGTKKVLVEFEIDFRKALLKKIKEEKKYRACSLRYSLIWPVFDMSKWDGHLMQGKEWKDMRYYWNKFFREHKVEFKTADQVDKNEMKSLVIEWKKQRTSGDRAYCEYYLNAIKNDFEGYDANRIIIVDGKVCAITAGFKVPGTLSDKNYYYSSIGIYNREFDRLGEIANMDDLIELKKKNYSFVDFGGGEKKLTEFKNKFKPTYHYKTHVFSIVKNETNKNINNDGVKEN